MPKFRKKPVEIEAVLWDGNVTKVVPLMATSTTEEVWQDLGDPALMITTLEGTMPLEAAEIASLLREAIEAIRNQQERAA